MFAFILFTLWSEEEKEIKRRDHLYSEQDQVKIEWGEQINQKNNLSFSKT